MCIKVCSNKAKKADTDGLAAIENYRYKIALPAPALYGQYKNVLDVNIILTALKELGFDEVFEVSHGAEVVTKAVGEIVMNSANAAARPFISSACPVISRLIMMKFPDLIGNILPVIPPVEVMARLSRRHVCEREGLKPEDVGVFFISPCAAKNTGTHRPLGYEKSEIDGVIAISDVYVKLRNKIRKITPDKAEILAHSSFRGVRWALSGGESGNIDINSIAVDGIDNVIEVLEELENGQLDDVDFIEALACTGGCIGGALTVSNPFVARNNIERLGLLMRCDAGIKARRVDFGPVDFAELAFTRRLTPTRALKLDADMSKALEKLERMEEFIKELPGIDCGACGSPKCETFARDLVMGQANMEDCIFMLRRKVKMMAESMVELASKLPQTSFIQHRELRD
jgi:hypothetical protein